MIVQGQRNIAMQNVVDFVVDCGADPTGISDSAPALDRAYSQLRSMGSLWASQYANGGGAAPVCGLTLYIPPGTYSIRSAVQNGTWNMESWGSSLEIRGEGDASVFILGFGYTLPAFGNLNHFAMRRVAFWGSGSGSSVDAAYVFIVGTFGTAIVEECAFHTLYVTDFLVQFQGAGAEAIVHWNRNRVYNCGTATNSAANYYGLVQFTNCNILRVSESVFWDLGFLDNFLLTSKVQSSSGAAFIYVAPGSGYATEQVEIRDCFFDEDIANAISIVGLVNSGYPGWNVNNVHIENIFSLSRGYSGVDVNVNGANHVFIESFVDGGGHNAFNLMSFANIQHLHIKGLDSQYLSEPSGSTIISIASSVQKVELEEFFPAYFSALASSAPVNTHRGSLNMGSDLGPYSDILSSGAATTAYYLAKIVSGAGIEVLATTDDAGTCLGVVQDAATASAQNVRVCREGEVTTMISDGQTTIVTGSKLIPSTTTGGQVKLTTTAGTAIVGIALTAPASGAGQPFTARFCHAVA